MKNYKKVVVVGGILLVALGLGGCIDRFSSDSKVNLLSNIETQNYSYNVADVKKIDIDGTASNIEFKEGTGDKVNVTLESNIKDIFNKVEMSNGELKISEKSIGAINFGNIKIKVIVEVPKGKTFDEVDIENNAGNIIVGDVDSKDISCESDAGNIHLDNSKGNNIELKSKVGNIEAVDVNGNTIDGESHVGNIDFKNVYVQNATLDLDLGNLTFKNDEKNKVGKLKDEVTLGKKNIEI